MDMASLCRPANELVIVNPRAHSQVALEAAGRVAICVAVHPGTAQFTYVRAHA